MSSTRILVVEDNRDLALGLRVNLEERGYSISVAHSLGDGIARVRQWRPSLVLLDLALPDGDGVEWTRRLRAAGDDTLVLMLTARSRQDAKVLGLRAGADDYVTKPFDIEELMTRVEVLLRRRRPADPVPVVAGDTPVVIGPVTIDPGARVIRRDGVTVEISRIAFDLLMALIRRRGKVVTRAELMRDVWGYGEDVATRTLDTHIFELRRVIEQDPGAPALIRTVWRIGYRFD